MIDDYGRDRGFRWYQFQAELFLDRGKETGKIGVRVRGVVRGHAMGGGGEEVMEPSGYVRR